MGSSSSKKTRDKPAAKSNCPTPQVEPYSPPSRSRSRREGSTYAPQSPSQSHAHAVSPKQSRTRERPLPQYRQDGTTEPSALGESVRRKDSTTGRANGSTSSGKVGGTGTHANYSNDYKRFVERCRSPRQKEKRGNSSLSLSHESRRHHRGPVQKREDPTLSYEELLQLQSPCTSEAAGTPSMLSASHRTMGTSSAAFMSSAAADERSSSKTRSAQQSARAVLPSPAYMEEEEEEEDHHEPIMVAGGPPSVAATSNRGGSRGGSSSSASSRRCNGAEEDDDGDDGDIDDSRSETAAEEGEENDENSTPLSLSFDIDLTGVGTAAPGDEDLNGCFTQKSSFSSFSDTDIQALIFREYAARRQGSKLSSRSSHSSKATSRISIRTMPHHRIEVVVPAEICDRIPALVKEAPAAAAAAAVAAAARDASEVSSQRTAHSHHHRKTVEAMAVSSSTQAPGAEGEDNNKKDLRQHVFSFTRCAMTGASLPLSYQHYRGKHLQQDKSAPPPSGMRKQAGRVCVHQTRSLKGQSDASDTNSTNTNNYTQQQQKASAEARRAAMAACYSFFASSHRDPNRGVSTGNNNNYNNNSSNSYSNNNGDRAE